MAHQPVVPTQQHSKSLHNTKDWERLLRDAGLPSEPPPQRNTYQLFSASSTDEGAKKQRFFDRNADAIFEAGQSWKRSPGHSFVCLFCGFGFYGAPLGTKYCTENHRKRHQEGKKYIPVLCVDCGENIHSSFTGMTRCERCQWYAERGLHRRHVQCFMDVLRIIYAKEIAADAAERARIARGIVAPTIDSYKKYCASLGVEASIPYYETILSTIR